MNTFANDFFESPRRSVTSEMHDVFAENGYLTFERAVSRTRLALLKTSLLSAYRQARRQGTLFEGGGTLHGHLNCFPGVESRFVYDELERAGIFDVVRGLAGEHLGTPNVGCNFNLPGSNPQNDHVDGYASAPFLIVNVAVVDTDIINGAMEVLAGTHRRNYKYWQLLWQQPQRLRVPLRQGDVLIRTSSLWHRGMPNLSHEPRPMLAFTWEDGGSDRRDPYDQHAGQITFLPNRYRTDFQGQLRERAFIAAPRLGTALRVARSFFE